MLRYGGSPPRAPPTAAQRHGEPQPARVLEELAWGKHAWQCNKGNGAAQRFPCDIFISSAEQDGSRWLSGVMLCGAGLGRPSK